MTEPYYTEFSKVHVEKRKNMIRTLGMIKFLC